MKIEEILAKKFDQKQDALKAYPGLLGDGKGQVVAGPGLVYVQIDDMVITAECVNVAPVYGLEVWVGYDQNHIFRVLGQRISTHYSISMPSVSSHAEMHELFGSGPLGGTDVIKVQLPQFAPLAVWPYDRLRVTIYPGIIWINNGYQLIADLNEYGKPIPKIIDFALYPAPDAGKEMYYLIGIDENGDVQVVPGNQVDLGMITLSDIPSPPGNMVYTLAAVRRANNQDAITINRESTDIVDLRFPIRHTHSDYLKSDALINELSDVDITSPQNGDVLGYDANTQTWRNRSGGGSGSSDVYFWIDGAVEAAEGVAYQVMPRDAVISSVYLFCQQTGTSGTTIVDIHKNGTTIFTTQSNRPSLAYNDTDGVTSGTPDVTVVKAGDVLRLDIDSAAAGAARMAVVIATGYTSVIPPVLDVGIDVGIDAPGYWPSSTHNEEFDSALSSSWIPLNMESNTYEVKNSALVVKLAGTSGITLRGLAKPIPPGYWRCYAKVGMSSMTRGSSSDWTSVGILLYDQNSGRLCVLINHRSYDIGHIQVNVELWNNFTSWNSNPTSQERIQYFHPYLCVAKKPTGWDFGYSYDGVEFCYPLIDYNLTFMSPTHIGLVAQAFIGSTSRFVGTMHWMRFEEL